jgi:hypothetical protein
MFAADKNQREGYHRELKNISKRAKEMLSLDT